jgi:hypothetical protein
LLTLIAKKPKRAEVVQPLQPYNLFYCSCLYIAFLAVFSLLTPIYWGCSLQPIYNQNYNHLQPIYNHFLVVAVVAVVKVVEVVAVVVLLSLFNSSIISFAIYDFFTD